MKREYYYKDSSGKIKKYVYCSLCLKGPYIEEQKDIDFFRFQDTIIYCSECMVLHFSEKITSSQHKQITKKVKTIIFEEKELEEKTTEVLEQIEEKVNEDEDENSEGFVVVKKIDGFSIIGSEKTKEIDDDDDVDKILYDEPEPVEIEEKSKAEEMPLRVLPSNPTAYIDKIIEEPEKKQDELPDHELSLLDELQLLTGKQIIEKVQKLTNETITISLKNKQSIVKKAAEIIENFRKAQDIPLSQ